MHIRFPLFSSMWIIQKDIDKLKDRQDKGNHSKDGV